MLHNTLADNATNEGTSGEGIHVGAHCTVAFTNTIVSGHPTAGITVREGSTVRLKGTLWYGNGVDTGGEGSIITSQDYVGGPDFIDPAEGNYHIGCLSAALDRVVNEGVTEDVDGETRPQGLAPDLGADEAVCGSRHLLHLPLILRP